MGASATSRCKRHNTTMKDEELNLEEMAEGVDADLDVPEDPGPALMGKTPVLGQLRRQNDMPVLRDELKDQL